MKYKQTVLFKLNKGFTMILFKRFTSVIIITCLLTTAVFSAQSKTKKNDYKIQIIDNCQIIKEYKMTNEQIESYLAFKVEEEKMSSLETPLSVIQGSLERFSEQIDESIELVTQEKEESLYIDKDYFKQQEHVVEKLSLLMKIHQKDFEGLEKQGEKFGKVADTFITSLEKTIGDIKHQNIHIYSPEIQENNHQCHNDIYII